MTILGIETSCDECAASIVADGRSVLSNVIATQIENHAVFCGVVPEIASRLHTEWISDVVSEALERASLTLNKLDAIAVTVRPGLIGSLLVGLSFAKGLSWSLGKPLIGVDHMLAHLYAPHLSDEIAYPYLGVLVSGGHTLIALVDDFDRVEIYGTTIDDACGEAFDKIAKFYGLDYPGGVVIDKLSKLGDPGAYSFPKPKLKKARRFDLSYSGLKTAAIHQKEQFHNPGRDTAIESLAASFQSCAISILMDRVEEAIEYGGLKRVVIGGGVAANSLLRERVMTLEKSKGVKAYLPPLSLCTDNGAMVAGVAYRYAERGRYSDLSLAASSRVHDYRAK